MTTVTLRYWAAARDAAGVAEQVIVADTLSAALAQAGDEAVRDRLAMVLQRSSFLINGDPVGRRAADTVELTDGAIIEVLPPFSGG
ncbi:MAG TPA: MoaD/ThiS family protein [Streptosporangiaceae bacterium]|nr:MoaD/ThiS family protein [Streptosporangiaceae bacterium]